MKLGGFIKTIEYNLLSNLPLLYTKSGINKTCNLIKDGDKNDNLAAIQRSLLYWHRYLVHMEIEKIKDFAQVGYLWKEIANALTPLYPFCMQAKQCRTSISANTAGRFIKSRDLRPRSKILCDQYQSREPGMICNNNGQVLLKEYSNCSTIFINHVSDFIFNFIQVSTDGAQKVSRKYKFETFTKLCGIDIPYYHADNKIFNNQTFKESYITTQQS